MALSPRLELDPSDVCLGESGSAPTKNVDRGLAELKKLTPEDLLLFDEEAHIRDDPAIGATWFLRGHQKKVRTTGAVSKGMSAVMPSLKCAPFTPRSGESRSLSSSFLGVKWEKILGLKPFETAPF